MGKRALLLSLLLLLAAATPVYAQGDLDCKDFASQAEAQSELNRDSSDPHRLDADDDGKACEDFGFSTSPGTLPDDRSPTLATTGPSPTLVTGFVLLLAGAGLLAVRRQKGRHER